MFRRSLLLTGLLALGLGATGAMAQTNGQTTTGQTMGVTSAGPGSANATGGTKQVTLHATMNGQQETPPNDSKGTGTATVTLNPNTHHITYRVSWRNLTGPATAAHIHHGAPGQPGPVIVPLGGKNPKSPIRGSATITPEQQSELLAGNMYVNVHTQQHPQGEIRGQLTTSQ